MTQTIHAKVFGKITDAGQMITKMELAYAKDVDPACATPALYEAVFESYVDPEHTGGPYFGDNPAVKKMEIVKTECKGNTVTVYFMENCGTVTFLKNTRNCPSELKMTVKQTKEITYADGTSEACDITCNVKSYKDLTDEECDAFTSVITDTVNYQFHKGTNDKLIVWFHGNGESDFVDGVTGSITGNNAAQMLSNRGTVAWTTEEAQSIFGDASVAAFQAPNMWYFIIAEDWKLKKQVKELIDGIAAENNINPEEIYVAGCSAGGFMSTRMVIAYPDFFKAAMITCPALCVADSRSGIKGATPTDEELKTLTQAKTKIWLVQCETDMVVATDECAKRIWKIITEGREVTETHFEGDRGIASGFTTYETADDRLKLTLYETKDSKFAIAEDYDQDGVYTKSEYMDHWSWCFTLRNNPEAKSGEHIWQWAAK